MTRSILTFFVVVTAVGFAAAAYAEQDLRNVGSLHAGMPFPDAPDFSSAYRQGFCGSADYATRMNRKNEQLFVAGSVGYNRFRAKETGDAAEDWALWNVNADARWYLQPPGEKFTGYVGLGPGLYGGPGGDTWFGGNVAAGADYPLGGDWSILLDIDQHWLANATNGAFVTVRLGAAYWFR